VRIDPPPFVEAFVGDELELGRIFHPDPVSHLPLKERGVLAKRFQHRFLVLPEQRLHEHRRVAKVGRHAHLGNADEMSLKHVVVHIAARKQLAQHMPHLLADAKQPDRAAFRCFRATHHIFGSC
jgi:hypothetical protein